jgi:hypothetical protein
MGLEDRGRHQEGLRQRLKNSQIHQVDTDFRLPPAFTSAKGHIKKKRLSGIKTAVILTTFAVTGLVLGSYFGSLLK